MEKQIDHFGHLSAPILARIIEIKQMPDVGGSYRCTDAEYAIVGVRGFR